MVLNWMTNQLGISLRETEDQLIRDMLLSSAGQINCVGGLNGDNPTEFTASDISGAGATLFNANAYTIADKIEGQNKFGTSPVRNSYFAMGNSNLTQSLDNVDGFIHSSQYPSQMNILESELIILSLAHYKSSLIDLETEVAFS
jgi:N4-gp56 family major capsid protein